MWSVICLFKWNNRCIKSNYNLSCMLFFISKLPFYCRCIIYADDQVTITNLCVQWWSKCINHTIHEMTVSMLPFLPLINWQLTFLLPPLPPLPSLPFSSLRPSAESMFVVSDNIECVGFINFSDASMLFILAVLCTTAVHMCSDIWYLTDVGSWSEWGRCVVYICVWGGERGETNAAA